MTAGTKIFAVSLVAVSIAAAVFLVASRHDFKDRPRNARPSASESAPDGDADRATAIAVLLRTADAANGARIFGQCAACHSIGRGGPDLDGPNLYGVLGAPVGRRRSRYAYTAALRQTGGAWDFDRLDAWLTHPRKVVPGTSMSFAGLSDPQDRADVIAYINTQGSNVPIP